jgi:hypothetical protein
MVSSPAGISRLVEEADIRHPLLRKLFSYWSGIALQGALPGAVAPRKFFDIVDVPLPVWPRTFMMDVLEGTGNYRVRVLGSYLVQIHGHDDTGRRLVDAEIPGATHSRTYALLERMMHERAPVRYWGPTSLRFSGIDTPHEQIVLPLGDDAGRITTALGAVDYPEVAARRAPV